METEAWELVYQKARKKKGRKEGKRVGKVKDRKEGKREEEERGEWGKKERKVRTIRLTCFFQPLVYIALGPL